jgi:hypothetical protein
MNESFLENGYKIISQIILIEKIEHFKCNLEKIIAENSLHSIRAIASFFKKENNKKPSLHLFRI